MAAIIQLACKGIQDYYLTVDPEITNFRIVYKRHTQFDIQTIKNTFTTCPNFNGKFSCTIGRTGDLLSRMFLVLTLPCLHVLNDHDYKVAWVRRVAFKLVKSVELEIGSMLIEKHYGEWYNIWYSLTVAHDARYNALIGESKELNKLSKYIPSTELIIPLSFWFNKNVSTALPLISLQEQEIKINIELCEASQCIIISPSNYIKIEDCLIPFKSGDLLTQNKNGSCNNTSVAKYVSENISKNRMYYEKICGEFCPGKIYSKNYCVTAISKECSTEGKCDDFLDCLKLLDTYLLCDYVLLCAEEKTKLAEKNMDYDYVIEQVLYCDEKVLTGPEQVNTIKFSNLCRELLWVAQTDAAVVAKQYFNYTRDIIKCDCNDSEIIKKETVLLDNIERITYRESEYFSRVQPYYYHTSGGNDCDGINIYSFSLFPEELQPSGAINLERISNVGLKLKINKNKKNNDLILNDSCVRLRCYARIYNVFRLCNGLGALLFNNNNI